MRIAIIGGSGIVGRELVHKFLKLGWKPTVISDGRGPFPPPPQVPHIIVDRRERTALLSALKRTDLDAIIDLILFQEDQVAPIRGLAEARRLPLLALSTSLVYQAGQAQALDEAAPLTTAVNGYGVEKRRIEQALLHDPVRRLTIFRVPHILGRGSELGAFPIHNRDRWLAWRIMRKLPVLLVEGGHSHLQFIDVTDLARGFVLALSRPEESPRVFSLAHPGLFTAREYVMVVASILGMKPEFGEIPRAGFVRSQWGWKETLVPIHLKTERAEASLGWSPETNLAAALQTAVNWHLKNGIAVPPRGEDYLGAVQAAAKDGTALISALNSAANIRPRPQVDIRMNGPSGV